LRAFETLERQYARAAGMAAAPAHQVLEVKEVRASSLVQPAAARTSGEHAVRRRMRCGAAFGAAGLAILGTIVVARLGGMERGESRREIASAASRVLHDGQQYSQLARAANPFLGVPYYVNPTYAASVDRSVATAESALSDTLLAMKTVPSAYWLDTRAKIEGKGPGKMEGILEDAAARPQPELVTFIVYNLPNRDCHAKASNGEICCSYLPDGRCDYSSPGHCERGLAEYRASYIDRIVAVLRKYDGRVPIVLIIEPDSLPNLATNRADWRCGNPATIAAYQKGILYAVEEIARHTQSVTMYLDAGHGGWLGWENNMAAYVTTVRDLGIAPMLRGFATNVAGYQALGDMCPEYNWCLPMFGHAGDACCYDPCGLSSQWNPSQNEHNYALHLRKAMSEGIPGFEPHMVIDTGRNGVAGERGNCANWCNIRGAGAGRRPTANTARRDIVDAYFWLKTPGESDGCTEKLPSGEACPRFDRDCGSADSIGSRPGEPRAPEAGEWFDFQVKQLARNARLE